MNYRIKIEFEFVRNLVDDACVAPAAATSEDGLDTLIDEHGHQIARALLICSKLITKRRSLGGRWWKRSMRKRTSAGQIAEMIPNVLAPFHLQNTKISIIDNSVVKLGRVRQWKVIARRVCVP